MATRDREVYLRRKNKVVQCVYVCVCVCVCVDTDPIKEGWAAWCVEIPAKRGIKERTSNNFRGSFQVFITDDRPAIRGGKGYMHLTLQPRGEPAQGARRSSAKSAGASLFWF